MSQSLAIFRPSGEVVYLTNPKIAPFNDLIYSLVEESHIELDANFSTTTSGQKRFYCLRREKLYAAIYFDVVSTIDADRIRQTLADVLKIYLRLTEEEDDVDEDKIDKLIKLQFDSLIKLRTDLKVSTPQTPHTPQLSKAEKPDKKKGSKKLRKWVNGELVEADDSSVVLDYSSRSTGGDASEEYKEIEIDHNAFSKHDDLMLVQELNDILGEEDDNNEGNAQLATSGFLGKLSSYFGGATDTTEIAKKFIDQLMMKNIAPSTAQAITDKIKSRLGKTTQASVFKEALTDELTKILTPNVSTDLLHDIKNNRSKQGRPYVISVVGVNGVGKSTNLAKLAYWLLQNNFNVLICACDTFRSGAVEQLKVHVTNLLRLNEAQGTSLRIDLFEKGYGGGDHVVNTARLAIEHAQKEKFDVVLIDTAGRTHSNAKLMAPLKKFGEAANPNKIIMVGEALVGTDSVEQATNFNNAFGNRRNLDFFIISKVDTVGDLVGAMINMVLATKVPILFVGTGQTYTDIKKLSVKRVVDMLMR